MPKDAPLAVEVPAPDKDKPAWVKVGVIAAVGFIIGIVWPRLVGVRLGPAAPGESAAAAAAAASASAHNAQRAPEAPPASVVVKAPGPAAAPVASSSATPAVAPGTTTTTSLPPTIKVKKGAVLSCKTRDGETRKGKECGAVSGIDQLVRPRVRKIATCAGVAGQTGKLSLVVNADFTSSKLSYDVGKSTTLPNVDALASCLKTTFHGTSTTSTPHEHPRYTVAYTALFASGAASPTEDDAKSVDGEAEDKQGDKPAEVKVAKPDLASGEAAVAWEVALVRDTPKTGGLLARLPRSTKVKVGAAKDGWFLIKYGEGYASEGWVYRGAIGR